MVARYRCRSAPIDPLMTRPYVIDAFGVGIELRGRSRAAAVLRGACADIAGNDTTEPVHVLRIVHRAPHSWTVRVDDIVRVARVSRWAALSDATAAIAELATSAVIDTDTVLQAGAVQIDDHAVALIGSQLAVGSLLTALGSLGHSYIANGVVAIEPTGVVRPFHAQFACRRARALGSPPDTEDVGRAIRFALVAGCRCQPVRRSV